MRFIADLHIHSKYSRATSRDMSPDIIWKWAQLKGITVIGTGDFTHPGWFRELNEKLEAAGNGLFRMRRAVGAEDVPSSCRAEVYFLLSAEISCIYSKNGRTRKVHSILFVPDMRTAERINGILSGIGNLSADGRPILGLDAKELLTIVMDCSPHAMLVPAHIWTPHFSVFGAGSGFDSLEECFGELAPHIRAIETGLSSDPPMNWRLSCLDRLNLISNSDAHSPSKIGREATILDTDVSYGGILRALATGRGLAGTIEFFPEEGKYHYDGHRACGVRLSPHETVRHRFICPVCGRSVTVGVMHRIEKLADRKEGFRPEGSPPVYSTVPLAEIISETLQVGVQSKAVDHEYRKVLDLLGSELKVLMDVPVHELEKTGLPLLGEAISRVRTGTVHITPGFDGEYGKVRILSRTS